MEAWNVAEVARVAGLPPAVAAAELRAALAADRVWRVSLFDIPQFAWLATDPATAPLVTEARARMSARGFAPELLLEPARRAGIAPLIAVLHGARGSAAIEMEAWQPAAATGCTVAALQSSQPSAPGLFCWDDRERTGADLRALAARLPRHGRVILAGFSQGAWLALALALRGDPWVPGGVVMAAPFIGSLDRLPAAARRLRVHVLAGAADQNAEGLDALVQRLERAGHHVTADVVPGLGHAYPPDFAARLPALVESVTRRS